MSQSIWTQCEGKSKLHFLTGDAYRVIEDQTTRFSLTYTDSHEDADILEEVVNDFKPELREGKEFEGLHLFLRTPFRYPPLKHGSRFGSYRERSIFYGSADYKTAMAEVAFYSFMINEATAGFIEPFTVSKVVFSVPVRTAKGIDLSRGAFAQFELKIRSPLDYGPTQELGREMRNEGVEAFRYPSARCTGLNLGVFTPRAFKSKQVKSTDQKLWTMIAKHEQIVFTRMAQDDIETIQFRRKDFLVGGRLPSPPPKKANGFF